MTNYSLPYQGPISHFISNERRVIWLLAVSCVLLTSCFSMTPPTPPRPQGIAILLSDSLPAFVGVQREIKKRYPQPIETYSLGGDENMYSAVQKKIQSSDKPVVVAIGLPAAEVARGLSGKKIIFCQVFNYEDADLVTSRMRGVAATPPVREQFRVWKKLSPGLKTVGVITGKNLHSLLNEARQAARENRIELIHVEVRSDKETLYAYKQLSPKIQGLWLVPDNRVLSREVIRDVMAYSVKEGKQVAVFSQQMLGLGGLLSAESNSADIAERVLTTVRQMQEGADSPVTALTKATIKINTVMAKRLNLPLTKTLRSMAYAH